MNKFSSKHLVLFIIGVAFISLKTYPSVFIDIGGRDTWISTLIASAIFTLAILYISYVFRKTETYDITYIFNKSYSKFLGTILLIAFGIGIFISAIEAASVEANVIHSTFFLQTPTWYCLFFFMLPTIFILNKDFRTLLIITIVCSSLLVINFVVFLFITQSYKNMDFILPVLGTGIDKDFILTIIMALGSLSSFAIILPYCKKLDYTDHIKKHVLFGGIIISLIVTISTLGVITAVGPVRSANIFYPEFILGQRVELAGFFEFGEFFFLIQTTVGFFIKYLLASYAIIVLFDKYIRNKKIFIFVYTLVTYSLSCFLSRSNFILYDLLKYYNFINIFLLLLIPLVAIIIFGITAKKKVIKE